MTTAQPALFAETLRPVAPGRITITLDGRILLDVRTAKGAAWLELTPRQWAEMKAAVDAGLRETAA